MLNERVTASSSTTKVLKLRLEEDTVTITKMELMELARNTDDAGVGFLREGVRVVAQALMEVEVGNQIGAGHGERNPEARAAQRNGYRDRPWDTRVGTVDLRIPKLRAGSFFPSLLEPRRRVDRALWGVIMTAYTTGTSTRKSRYPGVSKLTCPSSPPRQVQGALQPHRSTPCD